MTNLDRITISQQIMLGFLALHAPLASVKALFLNWEVYEVYYSQGNNKEVFVEVCFESTGLVCLFDKDMLCETVSIMPDNPADISLYIEYCQATYPYYEQLECWIINNFVIRKNIYKEAYCLSIEPLKKEEEQIIS